MSVYRVLTSGAEATLEVRKSVFRAFVMPVADEPAARLAIDDVRRAHPQARHHCSAFVIGPDRRLRRSNDDGEPSGTAGTPMLEALLHAPSEPPLSDVVAIVARWFGGIKLGTGGLARAYADAVAAALAGARVRSRTRVHHWRLELDHATAPKVESALRARDVTVVAVDYGTRHVTLELALSPQNEHEARSLVSAVAGRALSWRTLGEGWQDGPVRRL